MAKKGRIDWEKACYILSRDEDDYKVNIKTTMIYFQKWLSNDQGI